MSSKRSDIPLHIALIAIAAMTLLPFVFVLNNSLRRSHEQYHTFFGLPESVTNLARFTYFKLSGHPERIQLRILPDVEQGKPQTVRAADVPLTTVSWWRATKICFHEITRGFAYAWGIFRPYMINSLFVSLSSAAGVV